MFMEFLFIDIDILAVLLIGISLIGGLITGVMNRMIKLVAVIGGIAISYFFGNIISKAICNIEIVQAWINNDFKYGGIVILVCTYILLFLISELLIFLLLKPLEKLLTSTGVGRFFNHLLGGVVGVFSGFLLTSIIYLIMYWIGTYNKDVYNWIYVEFGYSENKMTISRWILDFALDAANHDFYLSNIGINV